MSCLPVVEVLDVDVEGEVGEDPEEEGLEVRGQDVAKVQPFEVETVDEVGYHVCFVKF